MEPQEADSPAPLEWRDRDAQCAVCGYRPGQVTPRDAAQTLRSIPRRVANRKRAVECHEAALPGDMPQRMERIAAHIGAQALDTLRAWPGGGPDVEDGEDVLEQACGQLAQRLDSTSSWSELLDEGGRLEPVWAKVSHLVHDAIHHLRIADGDLEGAISALADVDLDAGTYSCADG